AAFEIVDTLGDAPDIHCIPVGNAGNISAYWMLSDRPAEQEVVAGLERLGRQTVEEMRGLVGILRERVDGGETAPVPSLARVEELVGDVRAAGLPVRLDVAEDLPRLPPVLDLTAYRVLQEALTNVLRHAGAAPTTVVLGREGQALLLEVRNDPAPGGGPAAGRSARRPADRPAGVTAGGGHGLVGMRERLAMVHGTLRTGPEPDGGFAVRARFPLPRTWERTTA
ncbi:ATP-binding protein, partial [Nonomuraea sp. NPDC050691]|uniref:sensor histidine kinase n=1 Tax=Nonomuraea sp. NPDC050691 TaxID=3155661 RepID=UPI0033C34833